MYANKSAKLSEFCGCLNLAHSGTSVYLSVIQSRTLAEIRVTCASGLKYFLHLGQAAHNMEGERRALSYVSEISLPRKCKLLAHLS